MPWTTITATLTADNLYAVDTNSNTDTNPLSRLVAGATYYQTAPSDRYFHESWSHCSMGLIIHILKHNVFANILSTLAEKVIRKYFPIFPLVLLVS